MRDCGSARPVAASRTKRDTARNFLRTPTIDSVYLYSCRRPPVKYAARETTDAKLFPRFGLRQPTRAGEHKFPRSDQGKRSPRPLLAGLGNVLVPGRTLNFALRAAVQPS